MSLDPYLPCLPPYLPSYPATLSGDSDDVGFHSPIALPVAKLAVDLPQPLVLPFGSYVACPPSSMCRHNFSYWLFSSYEPPDDLGSGLSIFQ